MIGLNDQIDKRCKSQGGGGWGGREDTLIFSYIRRRGSFGGGIKILNFNIFGVFQKNEYILGSSQNWTIFRGSFLCILGSFLKVNVQNGNIFRGC